MAGRGPAPKFRENRRRRNVPLHGEWVELRPLTDPPIPDLPEPPDEAGWSTRTARSWAAWWADPAAQMWGAADVDLVEHLCYMHESWVRKGTGSVLSELRQVREALGLTPKGKQDRRWRVAPPAEVVDLDVQRADAEKTRELRKRAAAAEGDS